MQRIRKSKKVQAILTSDWHLRETTPQCYTGDFWEDQWEVVSFINDLQKKHDCIVLHAGDLFDHWKPSPYLLSSTVLHLPENFVTVYGQHDLPYHNIHLKQRTGMYHLHTIKMINKQAYDIQLCHFGTVPPDDSTNKVLLIHQYTYNGVEPFPGAEGRAIELLQKYPQYKLIVTGDNHQSFIVEYDGRMLVNPGNIMRQDADQIDFKPCVYLYYDDHTVAPVYLPCKEGVITRKHIETKHERDDRIAAFITTLKTDRNIRTVSFEERLEQFAKVNKVLDSVMYIIHKAISPEPK